MQLTGIALKFLANEALGVGKPRTFPVTEKRKAEGCVTVDVVIRM
jgi:hypothetical protein